jgi:hypothetical protein
MVTRMNDDLVVIGKMSAEQRAQKLMEVGDLAEPGEDMDEMTLQSGLSFKALFDAVTRPWEHTSHAFGFLDPADAGRDLDAGASGRVRALSAPSPDLVPVRNAADLEPDASLRDARIDITLERLRVAAYPGRGMHRILFDVYARSQREGGADDLHFNVLVRAREGESAAVIGVPVFVGLGVGPSGVALRCATVNVKNEDDESLLEAFDSDVMKNGLQLLSTAQPAVGVVSCMAVALTRSLATRHRNVAVQEFSMGLDLGGTPTGARLRLGTYFAVQAPDDTAATCWDEWAYNRLSGLLVKRDTPGKPIPYNYVAFGVRRHGGS